MSLPSKMRFGAQVHCFTTPPLSGFFKPAHLLKLHRSQIDNASYRIPIASMWMHVPWYHIWYHICHFAAPYPCPPCRMLGSVADMANPFPASQTCMPNAIEFNPTYHWELQHIWYHLVCNLVPYHSRSNLHRRTIHHPHTIGSELPPSQSHMFALLCCIPPG